MLYIEIILCLTILIGNSIESELAPTRRLNNGYEMPLLSFGAFGCNGDDCEDAIKYAIDIGYRHIDCAFVYGNEVQVGNAIRAKIAEGVITRDQISVTTKLWHTFNEPEMVEKAFQNSFNNLNLGYIDIYLMHFPVSAKLILKDDNLPAEDVNSYNPFPVDENGKLIESNIDYVDTWHAMEKLVQSGRVRSIGVANFNSQMIDRLLSMAAIKPVVNLNECTPNLNLRKLINFCAERDIAINGYAILGQMNDQQADLKFAISDSRVLAIAEKRQKTPSQIILRYLIQNGAVVNTKTTDRDDIKKNFEIFDFKLDDDEMESLHQINEDTPIRLLDFGSSRDAKYYPFNIEF